MRCPCAYSRYLLRSVSHRGRRVPLASSVCPLRIVPSFRRHARGIPSALLSMTLSVCFSAWTASIHFRPPRACSTRFSLFSRVITTSIALCFRSVASPWVRRLQLTSAFGGEVRPSLNSRPFSDVPRCNRLEVGQSISTILDDGVASASLPDPVSQVHMLARCYPRHNRGAIFSRPFCLRVTESRLFRLVLGMAVQITSSLQLFHAFRPFGIIHEHPQVQRQASGAPRAFLLPSGTVLHSSHSVL